MSNYLKYLKQIWQNIVSFVSISPNEVQVHQKTDRYGNQYWHAYHHTTGKSFVSGSEDDIRIWIDKLYRNQ